MGDLELVQRLGLATGEIVDGLVAGAAELVEEIALRRADRIPIGEGIDDAPEIVPRIEEQSHLRGGALREDLAELPKLIERDVRVAREVLLGLRAESHEPSVVMGEEGEVGRRNVHAGPGPA